MQHKFIINSLTTLDRENICERPRVSHKIREYIWEYIFDNILKPRRIMTDDTFCYHFTLSFKKFNSKLHIFFTDSPYNTEFNKFRPTPRFTIFKKTTKIAQISIISDSISSLIYPRQYANLVYDGLGSFLILLNKKITKEILDAFKLGLDYTYIDSFEFPASFEEQLYIGDNSAIDGVPIKEVYLSCGL